MEEKTGICGSEHGDCCKNGMTVIDNFYFSAMMWDRHRDPLHYCHPGPVDKWSEVIFNFIARGHIDDYAAWAAALSREIEQKGGLKNTNGVPFRVA